MTGWGPASATFALLGYCVVTTIYAATTASLDKLHLWELLIYSRGVQYIPVPVESLPGLY